MSSSLSNHQTGCRGRSARIRRTNPDLPLTYTLNGITVNFASSTPPNNALHKVGVVCFRTSRPVHGSGAEQKMVEAIGKNQYSKFKENESSLKDILKFEESHGLDENISNLCMFLETYSSYPYLHLCVLLIPNSVNAPSRHVMVTQLLMTC